MFVASFCVYSDVFEFPLASHSVMNGLKVASRIRSSTTVSSMVGHWSSFPCMLSELQPMSKTEAIIVIVSNGCIGAILVTLH